MIDDQKTLKGDMAKLLAIIEKFQPISSENLRKKARFGVKRFHAAGSRVIQGKAMLAYIQGKLHYKIRPTD